MQVTPAQVSDSTVFESILDNTNTNRAVYADRGYAKQAREVQLREHGYRDYIQRKGNAHKSISETQKRRNKRIAKQLSLW